MNEEKLLTREEVAAALPLPTRTVYTLTASGKIPVIRLTAHCHRYKLSEVRAAIDKCTVRAVRR